jgi:hypothetical protein
MSPIIGLQETENPIPENYRQKEYQAPSFSVI